MSATQVALLSEARLAVASGRATSVREAAGLSQGEVARAIGVTPATLSRWEARQRRPTGGAAVRYARLLRMLADAS